MQLITVCFLSIGLDKSLGYVSKSTFPLPTLGPVLSGIAKELHTGRGFSVLRGIPVDSYSREDVVIIYGGVSSYVGDLRGMQDSNGGVLAHIKDLSGIYDARAIGAPAFTTDPQVPFLPRLSPRGTTVHRT